MGRLFKATQVQRTNGRYNKGWLTGAPFFNDDSMGRYFTSLFGEQGTIELPDGTVIIRPHRHMGLDIHAAKWTKLRPLAYGHVKFRGRAGFSPNNGYHVVIDHGRGVETWYLHMVDNELEEELPPHISLPQVGDVVFDSTLIGWADGTGNPTQGENAFIDHLHLGVRVNGIFVDPITAVETLEDVAPSPPPPPAVSDILDEQTMTEFFGSFYHFDGNPLMGTRALQGPTFMGFGDSTEGEEIYEFRLKRPKAERPEED